VDKWQVQYQPIKDLGHGWVHVLYLICSDLSHHNNSVND
jgi:hypothetical protein